MDKISEESRDDAFGAVNARQPGAQGNAYDFNSVRANLRAFAARSDYNPNQYQKIMKLLNEEDKTDEMVNMTGNFISMELCSLSAKNEDCVAVINARNDVFKRMHNWIIDSWATCHMSLTLENLNNVNDLNKNVGRRVHLPNGQTTLVTHSGRYGELDNVLVVFEFKYDLLLVSQLTRQLQCSVCSNPEFCIFQDLSNREVKGTGKEIGGLYYLPSAFSSGQSASGDNKVLMTKTRGTDCMLCHNRMGHPSIKVLKRLTLVNKDFDVTECGSCSVCP